MEGKSSSEKEEKKKDSSNSCSDRIAALPLKWKKKDKEGERVEWKGQLRPEKGEKIPLWDTLLPRQQTLWSPLFIPFYNAHSKKERKKPRKIKKLSDFNFKPF